MLTCINKSSIEYQTLKLRSGISDFLLEATCRGFLDRYNRFPYLDELPNSNSEPHLKDRLHIDQYNGTEINRILDETGTNNILEANILLNDQYRDLEIELISLNKEAIVDITHRPTTNNYDITSVEVDESPNSYLVFNNALLKLANLYGIQFNEVNDLVLNTEQWRNIITDPMSVNAFVHNGLIYINTDRCSVDAPLHEMMHILIGSIHFQNPNLYNLLISTVDKFPNYQLLILKYPNRTRQDVNEEIFITEASRFLMGLPSAITSFPASLLYEILYNTKRVLDTILMGLDSVKTISDTKLYNLSLKELTLEVNSAIMTNNFRGFINERDSAFHRKLNNIKSDLYSKGLLEEHCQ